MNLEQQYFELGLRLLLEPESGSVTKEILPDDINWHVFLRIAQENKVVVRLYNRLLQIGVQPADIYQSYINTEQKRIKDISTLMGDLNEVFKQIDIEFIFMKNYQHYPDMGDDIDLLIMGDTQIDHLVVEKLNAKPCQLSFLNRIGGKTQYHFDCSPTYLEIHHCRMGPVGDHTLFPHYLVQNRRTISLIGMPIFVPSLEDQLIVQVLQRMYGRFYIRLSELFYCANAFRTNDFDWDYITRMTKEIGIYRAFCWYLEYINLLIEHTTGDTLPLEKIRLSNKFSKGKINFYGYHYHMPMLNIGGRLYLEKFFSDIQLFNWDSVARLTLAPFLYTIWGVRSLTQRIH